MNPALLTSLLQFLLQAGPLAVSEYEALKASGTADAATLAKLGAQIDTLDTQRMADWATADAALTKAAGTS